MTMEATFESILRNLDLPKIPKVLDESISRMLKLHPHRLERSRPAKIDGQKGLLGISGIYFHTRVWFDTDEGSKTYFGSVTITESQRREALKHFVELCKEYGC